jgi:thiamine-monophosphate kinase
LRAVSGDQASGLGGELAAIERLAESLPPAPVGETWIGDDTAVLVVPGSTTSLGLAPPAGSTAPAASPTAAAAAPTGAAAEPPAAAAGPVPRLLFATDLVVAGVHFDLTLSTASDVGWKVLASNVSDVAAMGGRPWRCVAGIAGGTADQVEQIGVGMAAAAARWDCPLVGGDLSAGEQLVVSVAILGLAAGEPILRSGARPGDVLFVTGGLGAAAAGLRRLRADPGATGELVEAHRRPEARVQEGLTAAAAGATAMIDVSDGLGLDLHRLALASHVGVELDAVPAVEGATAADAFGGGEDYELIIAAADAGRLIEAFDEAGLRRPIAIGRCVEDQAQRLLGGEPFSPSGWEHQLR